MVNAVDRKEATLSILKNGSGLRIVFGAIIISIWAIVSKVYFVPAAIFLGFEVVLWIGFFLGKRNNKIVALATFAYWSISPELFGVLAITTFCYGAVWRNEAWLTVTCLTVSYIYARFFVDDSRFDTNGLARKIRDGQFDGAWPQWSELDWFGKLFLYVMWGPTFIAIMMFGVAMWADDLPESAQHKYIMAGGYACTFLAMNLTAMRIWLRRVKRTVQEHDLDWA